MGRPPKAPSLSPEDEQLDEYLKLKLKSSDLFSKQNQAEKALLALVASKGTDGRLTLASGRVLRRKDNFEGENLVFKKTAFSRFSVAVEEGQPATTGMTKSA